MASSKSEVKATMSISIHVDCPNDECENYIDILDERDTDDYCHNEEGHVLNQACPDDGHWSVAHEKFEVNNVTCSECKQSFNVKGLEW